jgi:monoamine oxidase
MYAQFHPTIKKTKNIRMKEIKRRDFIKNSMIAGIGAPFATAQLGTVTEEEENHDDTRVKAAKKKRVIVAGAGITGLCCGYELMQSGHDVTVLEAKGRHGGHVFTGRDGLSDGLYADFGADHITRPGYERFFEYVDKFKLEVLVYPHAEGSDAAPGRHAMRMINKKFYTDEQLSDPKVLATFGFNQKEIKFLSSKPWYELQNMYLDKYVKEIKDIEHPLGTGHDEWDKIPVSDLYKKEGASEAALRYLGGNDVSALFTVWRIATTRSRGIPPSHGDTFRLKGGNQELPNAFARKLGDRVKLSHQITAIRRDDAGVAVSYRAYGYDEEKELTADYLVNCIPLPVFRKIPVTPALSPEKQYVVDNLKYSSHPFYVFEAATKFWLDDGFKSINMEFEHPDISSIWQEPNEVKTGRIILKAYAPGGVSAQRGLAAFREVYPGKSDTITQALTVDWTKDQLSPTCEMEPFPIGELHKFWPQVTMPDGRIYFAGTYADILSRGMESCIRSAQRVAKALNDI